MSLFSASRIIVVPLLLGQLAYAQPSIVKAHASGELVYKSVCYACHESGVANAPKFADRTAWKPLIEEGQAILSGHAWVGVRAMPARGGNAELSLADFARAVAYMARAGGADWKDPDAAVLLSIAKEAEKRLTTSIKEQQAMQRELRSFARIAPPR